VRIDYDMISKFQKKNRECQFSRQINGAAEAVCRF